MTKDKDEKAVIRARMAKTGESYATARAQLSRGGAQLLPGATREAPEGALAYTEPAEQAQRFATRSRFGSWLLIQSLRATDGTAAAVLEKLGMPKETYDQALRRSAPRGPVDRGPLDAAMPLVGGGPEPERLRELMATAYELARKEGAPAIDSGRLLRAALLTFQPDEHSAADQHLVNRLRSADMAAMCAEVERERGPEQEDRMKTAPGLFDRFTDRARVATVAAQEEARLLGHNWIGTEHLLLGLLNEGGGLAARVMGEHQLTLEVMRDRVADLVPATGEQLEGHIPFTPRSKSVFELSRHEALVLGHEHIGTEHLLLALSEEGGGIAAQLLTQHGLGADVVRAEVLALIGIAYPAKGAAPPPDQVPGT